ncbi:GAF domain-containing protein [Streptosporangiaceae bacterium NEAU-GS5]|nr:GAF domain-containing protein [Streptosporangiaceae bacterium NEAU-GS5]
MRQRLEHVHEAVLSGARLRATGPRKLISASWQRSLAAGIDPEAEAAPLIYSCQDLGDVRSAHPLQTLLPLLRHTLLQIADEAAHIMVITDADGSVLWRDGHSDVQRRADMVGLADGFRWTESAIGTNGIGTALALRAPAHVYSAEHLVRALHSWSCVAAPVVDPDTGRVLGCIDISGTAPSLHPATLALVATAASLAESHLALRMREQDELVRTRHQRHLDGPGMLVSLTGRMLSGSRFAGQRVLLPESGHPLLLSDGTTARVEALGDAYLLLPEGASGTRRLELTLLGADKPLALLNGAPIPLSLRHAEILLLLAFHPRGLTAEQLSFLMYGDEGNPVTIRAEIFRLRAQLGGAIEAKPYRFTCEVDADVLQVRRALATADLATLARVYLGPLLPRSEAPAIRRYRDELEAWVRAELLARGSPADLWAYAQTSTGCDDIEILERVMSLLPPSDHRHTAAALRLRGDYD